MLPSVIPISYIVDEPTLSRLHWRRRLCAPNSLEAVAPAAAAWLAAVP